MNGKKSKSRFSEISRFVPEDDEEIISSKTKSNSKILTHSLDDVEEEIQVKKKVATKVPINNTEKLVEEEIIQKKIKEETKEMIENHTSNLDIAEIANNLELDDDFEEEYEEEYEEESDLDKENLEDEDIKNMEEDEMAIEAFTSDEERQKNAFGSRMSVTKELTESVILGNTTIKGDIVTDAGIQIYGAVIGNIESGGKVQLVGKVEGDITGKVVVVTNTLQTGNITAENEVYIKEGCMIEGDIEAGKVVLKGSVKGNINSSGQVDFDSNSSLEGNVIAHSFNIKPGAKINGSIGTR